MSTINYKPANGNSGNDIMSFSSEPRNPIILILLVFVFIVTSLATLLYLHYHRNSNITTLAVPVAVPAIALGLNADAVDCIPIFLHESIVVGSTGKYEKEECTICLGLFEDGEKVKVLPVCLHVYHSGCVDKWLKNKSSCPLCRSSLDSISATSVADESAIVFV
ncbi:RING-type E3 ubiquitin transferase [Heracleum sosnowskyi]|uniref:RING-type E3 ubiquitin transferase n=1 Tax=Heracleum sosnowskyi TaxID=360622 RepID=A0AAD8HW90_9APIA|nr:RING-type E3 ubiquitin transferase [Heracleum sosnowskyi]